MAKESKSSKSNDKTEKSDAPEVIEPDTHSASESTSGDAPVVIEAEAVDVTDDVVEPSEGDDAEAQDAATDVREETMAAASPPPAEPRRASILPLFFGGALAAGAGYFAAIYTTPPLPPIDATLSESVAEVGTRLDALSADLAELQGAPTEAPDLSGFESGISDITARLADVDTELASVRDAVTGTATTVNEQTGALSERLTVLETAGSDNAEAEATKEELAAFRAELERMTTEAEARVGSVLAKASQAEAAAEAKAAAAKQAAAEVEQKTAEARAVAERQAAIVDLKAALENGTEYASILPSIGAVPEVLSANAKGGVPTLLSIQQAYPDAARAALASAEAAPQDASTGERLTAFLKRQTNARSLKPKEGDSADAVLSRAEAMLKQGDLDGTLVELDALTDEPKAAMQDWLDNATTRAAAIDAISQLSVTN